MTQATKGFGLHLIGLEGHLLHPDWVKLRNDTYLHCLECPLTSDLAQLGDDVIGSHKLIQT